MGRREEERKGRRKEGRDYGICKKLLTFPFFRNVFLEISVINLILLLSSKLLHLLFNASMIKHSA